MSKLLAVSITLRVSVPPILDEEVIDLRVASSVALDPKRIDKRYEFKPPPKSYKEVLYDKNYDPRSQLIYSKSFFYETDKPYDQYTAYILLEGERYYVEIWRDAMTGEIVRSHRLGYLRVDKERIDWLFKRLEERQKELLPAPKDTKFPTSALNGTPCPKTGHWWAPDVPGERFLKEGEFMPDLEAFLGPFGNLPNWYQVQE